MPNLNSAQAEELAKHYAGLSLSTAKYRFNNWDKLTEAKRKQLSEQSAELGKQSDQCIKLAATLIMEDVKADLAKIKIITNEIQTTIEKISSVQKVVNVIAAALDLGAAIISKVPLDIVKKIEDLNKAWNNASKNLNKSR